MDALFHAVADSRCLDRRSEPGTSLDPADLGGVGLNGCIIPASMLPTTTALTTLGMQ
jgi:hypothetical protein